MANAPQSSPATPTASNPLGVALPAPGSLIDPAARAASGATLLSHFGAEADAALPVQHAAPNGTMLSFTPAWTPAAPHPDGLGLALYRFTVAGYDGPTDLHVDWSGPASTADHFVALADFPRQRWTFLPVADGVVSLTAEQFAAATAPNSLELLVVAIATGEQSSDLSKIRIGAEQGPLNIVGVTPTAVPVYRTAMLMPVYTGEEPADWEWNLGGMLYNNIYHGRTLTAYMPTKGAFNCTLKATDTHGNVTVFPFQVNVLDHSQVSPDITAVLPTAAETGTQQLFYPFEDGGVATTYNWNFGGGATPNTSNDDWPSVVLGAPGAYNASVTASNSKGSTTFSFTLYVVETGGALPPSLYDIGFDTYEQLLAGRDVTISAMNDGAAATSYSWDFGGGATPATSSEASPKIALPKAGVFNCTVSATNAVGTSTLPFKLTVTQPAAPNLTGLNTQEPQTGIQLYMDTVNAGGMGYNWVWNFGGACTPNTSTEVNPKIVPLAPGTYHGTVIANNNVGSSTLHFDLVVNDPPAPHLTDIDFTDATTSVPTSLYVNSDGGLAASWSWGFGGAADPNTSAEQYPSLTPLAAGVYHCTVTATNASGSSTLPFDLNVTDMQPPVLDQVIPGQVMEHQLSNFFANTSCQFQMTWSWDFGGGCTPNTSTDQFPQVTTGDAGTFNCTVTATNAGGSTTFPFVLNVLPNP